MNKFKKGDVVVRINDNQCNHNRKCTVCTLTKGEKGIVYHQRKYDGRVDVYPYKQAIKGIFSGRHCSGFRPESLQHASWKSRLGGE